MSEHRCGKATREKILNVGLDIWPNVSPTIIARVGNMTRQNVSYHFPNDILRDAVARHAVLKSRSRIIVQLIAEDHPAVAEMSDVDRTGHFKAL